MQNNLESVFLRLGYALREAKHVGNSTIILGADVHLAQQNGIFQHVES